ncbi:MAG: phenylalanine--tRNA ligase subunit beta [Verrucomicrobia bacterium]|nr:phenylalanine--tRNA ligase subunit beta [Verrucomicrobiota bacterium]
MKVPLSWLKEYLNFTQSPQELADVLTLAGIEVEGIDASPLKFSGVVVGKVLEASKHPSADRLTVAKVTDGKEEFQIVCGASNCRAGIKVAFAKIGASLCDEEGKAFKIKRGKLRDVESFGMLCAADELGLGTGEGIMELPEAYELGVELSVYYSDVILEVSLTPNLGHCMSILGLARDLSAQLGIPVKKPTYSLLEQGDPIEKLIQVQLIDKKQCPRYACRAVMGIKVGPSPDWLKKKVEASGVRSINNVVDVGNLVMLEVGQPLHMFDYDKISGKKLIITAQTEYKEIHTLDGTTRPIPPESLLICDTEKPLAFAGVMGGDGTAVSDATVNVLIESAYFSPQSIRKTTKLINLKSDSSQRFEKGIDPNNTVEAVNYAAYLLQKVAGGNIAKGAIDHKAHEFTEKKIVCRTERANKLIGTNLSTGEIAGLLGRLGIQTVEEKLHELLVCVPTYRNDISIEVDLIEEVARVYGYNNIPKPIPQHISSTISNAPLYELETAVRARLVGEGLQELMTCDLISPTQAAMAIENAMNKESLIAVMHSHSVDQSVLRATLLPGLLQAVKYNFDHGSPNIAGFEVGRVHFKENDQYFEPSTAGIILSGKRAPYHWDPKPQEFDFYDLKGYIENLLSGLKIDGIEFEVSHLHNFHPGRQAKIKKANATLGVLGEVHPDHVAKIDVPQRIFFAEINLNELMPLMPKQWKVADLAQFPGSERDWTVTLNDDQPIESVLRALKAVPSRLLEKVTLLDLYKSDQIGKDKKNATFRFFYRDTEKTIAFETVEKEHARITAAAAGKLGMV